MALSKRTTVNTEVCTHYNTTHFKPVQSSSYHRRAEVTQRVWAEVEVVLGGSVPGLLQSFSGTGTTGKTLLACKPFSEGFGLKSEHT